MFFLFFMSAKISPKFKQKLQTFTVEPILIHRPKLFGSLKQEFVCWDKTINRISSIINSRLVTELSEKFRSYLWCQRFNCTKFLKGDLLEQVLGTLSVAIPSMIAFTRNTTPSLMLAPRIILNYGSVLISVQLLLKYIQIS